MTDHRGSSKRRHTEAEFGLFDRAVGAFVRDGTNVVPCDECGEIIQFEYRRSAILHKCRCGKYTGTLRQAAPQA